MHEIFEDDPTVDLAFKTQGTRPLRWSIVRDILLGTTVPLVYADVQGQELYLANLWTVDDIKETDILQILREKSEQFEQEASRITIEDSEAAYARGLHLKVLGSRAVAAAEWFNESLMKSRMVTVDHVPLRLTKWGAFHD